MIYISCVNQKPYPQPQVNISYLWISVCFSRQYIYIYAVIMWMRGKSWVHESTPVSRIRVVQILIICLGHAGCREWGEGHRLAFLIDEKHWLNQLMRRTLSSYIFKFLTPSPLKDGCRFVSSQTFYIQITLSFTYTYYNQIRL